MRPVEVRLLGRDKEPRAERSSPGEKLRATDLRVRSASRTADPYPNAPLLKRIVRYPYRLETTFARRFQLFEPGSASRERVESLPPASRVAKEARGTVVLGNPLRLISYRLEPRKRPTVNEWLAGGAE